MARFSRIQVAQAMTETGFLPLFHFNDAEAVKSVVKACYEGGARVFEMTNRGDFAHEIFAEVVKYASKEFPDMIIGVGSIIDAPTAALYMQLGANFIVCPIFNPEIAYVCNRRKVLWVAGCGTLSEISKAEELGAEIVKLFPANQTTGPEFVKAIKGPMPWTSILPTGGIEPTEASIKPWIKAGAVCLGLGSNLITKEIVATKNFDKLKNDVANVLAIIKECRK
jgi:2-dehydro-3-deoxyphosphogluconate aldolase / (4S)-4-hydroxy-2-oxoglutarate aldolase